MRTGRPRRSGTSRSGAAAQEPAPDVPVGSEPVGSDVLLRPPRDGMTLVAEPSELGSPRPDSAEVPEVPVGAPVTASVGLLGLVLPGVLLWVPRRLSPPAAGALAPLAP